MRGREYDFMVHAEAAKKAQRSQSFLYICAIKKSLWPLCLLCDLGVNPAIFTTETLFDDMRK